MSKTILFFDRCELTYLYGRITPFIENAKVIHVAYSQKEADILKDMNVKADYVYLNIFKDTFDSCVVEEDSLHLIDEDIIKYSNDRFNLNGAIQSDRAFSLLSYEDSLKSAVAHYQVWQKIFQDHHVDLLLHEPCSLFFNYIASILCNKQGGIYTYQVQVEGDKPGFWYLFANNDSYLYEETRFWYDYYKRHLDEIDRERCINYLERFRKDETVFFGSILNLKKSTICLYCQALKSYIIKRSRLNKVDKHYDLIDYWLLSQNSPMIKVRNKRAYKSHKIQFENVIPEGEKYFFYPMHLEPEAVVQYLGDGIYVNQIKLIENVAAALPPGYYLYVKDHPHEYAYRDAADYERLQKVPNIRLLSQWLPGKKLIKGCVGLVTINGTAGFEALMMGKPVYCFGRNQYSFHSHVNHINNIRDLRKVIYKTINIKLSDDDDMYAYIMAFLKAQHFGYVNFFLGTAEKAGIDQDENARQMSNDIVAYIDFMEHSK